MLCLHGTSGGDGGIVGVRGAYGAYGDYYGAHPEDGDPGVSRARGTPARRLLFVFRDSSLRLRRQG
jgi:hypothetical protein